MQSLLARRGCGLAADEMLPCIFWSAQSPVYTLNTSPLISPQLTHLYEWELLENQSPSEVERESEAGLPTGQRCIVGYWLVLGAAVGAVRKHIYTDIIDKGSTTLHLCKDDRYFIILWEEIRFHSRYMKTRNALKWRRTGGVRLCTEKHISLPQKALTTLIRHKQVSDG